MGAGETIKRGLKDSFLAGVASAGESAKRSQAARRAASHNGNQLRAPDANLSTPTTTNTSLKYRSAAEANTFRLYYASTEVQRASARKDGLNFPPRNELVALSEFRALPTEIRREYAKKAIVKPTNPHTKGPNPKDTDNQDKGHSHVVPATLVTGGLLAIAFAVSQLGGGRAPVANATGSEGLPTSSPTESATPTESPSATPSPELVRVATPEDAARMFGADDYTRLASSWEINQYGQAHLKDRLNDNHAVRIRTNGAVADGWVRVPQYDGRIDSENIVSIADELDVNGVTLWLFRNRDQGLIQIATQQYQHELTAQPGTLQNCVYTPDAPTRYLDTSHLIKIAGTGEAAKKIAAARYGADSYSLDWHHWIINQYGQAELIASGRASRVRTGKATVDGWWLANTDRNTAEGRRAIVVVVNPNLQFADINGGTFWLFDDEQAGYRQILAQVMAKEPNEQPEVLVYPIKQCVRETSPSSSASPTTMPLSYERRPDLSRYGNVFSASAADAKARRAIANARTGRRFF
jgi:hypothetical protein